MFGLRPGEIATQSGERLLADSRKRLLRHGRLGAGGTLPQHGLLALQLGHRRCVQAVRFPERRPASIHARMIEPTRLAGVAQDRPDRLDRRRKHSLPSSMRSEEHTSELQSLMRISYDVFCLKKKKNKKPSLTIVDTRTRHKQQIKA